jgi:hypothetical protein
MSAVLDKLVMIAAEGGNVVLKPEESLELVALVHSLQDKANLVKYTTQKLGMGDAEDVRTVLAPVLELINDEGDEWVQWGIDNGQLWKAAVAIMKVRADVIDGARARRMGYPWKKETWKDEDRVRNLRRSVGLLIAELARWGNR